jgi:hypothetical protein
MPTEPGQYKFYVAGNLPSKKNWEQEALAADVVLDDLERPTYNRMLTFASNNESAFLIRKFREEYDRSKINIFLDCGAVSFYSKYINPKKLKSQAGTFFKDRSNDDFSITDTKIYLDFRDDYIEFLKEYKDKIDYYPNFDVINNGEKTWQNQLLLESEGLKPIPVYHVGTDIEYLKRYLKRKDYKYIAIGGNAPNPTSRLIRSLDRIWSNYLTDKENKPIIKVHGFGVASGILLFRYPWYSSDSATPIKVAMNGKIMLPKFKYGKWNYDLAAEQIAVSDKSSSREKAGQHIDTVTADERHFYSDYIESMGFALRSSDNRGVMEKNNHNIRALLNLKYFCNLEAQVPGFPNRFEHSKPYRIK